MWSIILTVAVIVLFFKYTSLQDRVRRLEQQKTTQTKPAAIPAPTGDPAPIPGPVPAPPEVTTQPDGTSIHTPQPVPQPPTTHMPQPQAVSEPAEFFLITWFKEQTLIKVGSIIFFLGAAWFVSYAIEQNWIPPFLRILLGLLLAVAVYAVGHIRKRTESTQYQVLTTLGTAIVLATITASQFAFAVPIFPPVVALLIMVISIGYTVRVAINTDTEWLGAVASIAGIFVPFLTGDTTTNHLLLLTYTLLLSVGFITVVFFTAWRSITLLTLLGSALHLSLVSSAGTIPDLSLWLFVILFSGLFFTSTTVSLLRTNTAHMYDVSIMSILTVQYIAYALTITMLPELALFAAAAVTAGIGYMLRMRNADADAVSLYAAVSLIGIFSGTAMLFDGFVLTIALSLETLMVYLLSLKIATVKRSIFVAGLLFILPVLSGIGDLVELAGSRGIFHPELLGVITLIATLGFAIIWSLRSPAMQAIEWLRMTAGTLATGWYAYTAAACVAIGEASSHQFESVFTTSVLLTLLSSSLIVFALLRVNYASWHIGTAFGLIIPTIAALASFDHRVWSDSIAHQPFFAALFFFAAVIVLTMLYWSAARRTGSSTLNNLAYSFVWVALGYGMIFWHHISDALLTGDAERVVSAVGFIFLIYLTINCLLFVQAPIGRIAAIVFTLLVPALYLAESLQFDGWRNGILDIDAIGLYVAIIVLTLLSVTF